MAASTGPPPAVLAAFGQAGPAVRLPGGQGSSWRVGDVVLKPDVDPRYQEWLGTAVAAIEQRGFRLPTVRRAADGAWVVQGWAAQSLVPGHSTQGTSADWRSVIDASRALHRATEPLERPAFLDLRDDPWAQADRAAWAEAPRRVRPELSRIVARLTTALASMAPAQVVHGDLTDNVLLVPGGPPSIIDFSPYWRPPAYAEGIVIADALCWHDASPEFLEDVDVPISAVARGLLFRVLTVPNQPQHSAVREQILRYESVLAALGL